MSLRAAFAEHLRTGRRTSSDTLAGSLEAAGLVGDQRCYLAWCAGERVFMLEHGPWARRAIVLGARPPTGAAAGALWFDVCELVLMVQAGRAWLATRPTARWQMGGFLDVAERSPRAVQIAPPYLALDPARLAAGDEAARTTNLTAGESTLYAWWFGKMLPHLFDWQSAVETLAGDALRELWQTSMKEWTSSKLSEDEAARIFVTPSTIGWDPDDVVDDEVQLPEQHRRMIRGEYTRDLAIGFRTSVLVQTGLLATASAWSFLAEDVRLASLLDRERFRRAGSRARESGRSPCWGGLPHGTLTS